MEEYDRSGKVFTNKVEARIFEEEHDQVVKIVNSSRTEEGFRKYENVSHFIRCAIIKLIQQEKYEPKKRGRPKVRS